MLHLLPKSGGFSLKLSNRCYIFCPNSADLALNCGKDVTSFAQMQRIWRQIEEKMLHLLPKSGSRFKSRRRARRASESFRERRRASESFRELQGASESVSELQRASESVRELQRAADSFRERQRASESVRELQRASESFRELQRASESFRF